MEIFKNCAFLNTPEGKLADWTIVSHGYFKHESTNATCVFDLPEKQEFRNKIAPTKQGTVPKGSLVYMIPPYKYSMEDIRQNYKICRSPQKADYIVVPKYCDLPDCSRLFIGDNADVNRSIKTIICNSGKAYDHHDPYQEYNLPRTGWTTEDTEYFFNEDRLFIFWKLHPFLIELYKSTAVYDNLVNADQLDISSENILTQDVLNLVYQTSKSDVTEENIKTYINQLMMFNQHNWREYPYTTALLMYLCKCGKIGRSVAERTNRWPKPVRELNHYEISQLYTMEPKTENDYRMAQEFVMHLFDFASGKVCNCIDLQIKLCEFNLPLDLFNLLFDTATRITTKKYTNDKEAN